MSWVCSLELQEQLLLYSSDTRKYYMISVGVVILFKWIRYPFPLPANRIQPLLCWKACQELPYLSQIKGNFCYGIVGGEEGEKQGGYLFATIWCKENVHVSQGCRGTARYRGEGPCLPCKCFFLFLLTANLCLRLKLKNMDGSFTRI